MSAFLFNKLSFEDTKQIMLSSLKALASLPGLLALFLPIIAGGGLLTLIMKNVTMEGLAFFILQPVVLTLYLTAILCRYQSSELRLSVWQELRNFIVVLVYALFLTILMIVILWLVKFMIASAVASETNHIENKQPIFTNISLAYSNLILYFNMYALATLSVFIATPMLVFFIPTVTRCKGSLLKSLPVICKSTFLNIGPLFSFSAISGVVLLSWSYFSLRYEWLIPAATIPLAYLSILNYQLSEAALPPNQKKGNL
ncbi:hypothetical protein H9T43_002296 [Salmonella enterica]|nr:hypothetical protein [Salmonella enterica]